MRNRIPWRLTTGPVEARLLASIKIGDQVFAFEKAYRVIGFRGERLRLERDAMYRRRKPRTI